MTLLFFRIRHAVDTSGMSPSPDVANATKTLFSYKYHWSEQRQSVALRVSAHGLHQLDPANKRVLATYNFKDIEAMYEVTDYPGGFVIQSKVCFKSI